MCTKPAPILEVIDEGCADYHRILDKQREIFNSMVEKRKAGLPIERECVLLVEHNPVYTLGRHGHESNLIAPVEVLEAQGIEVIRIERGGDITYHGPGQLVVYPILDMLAHNLGVKSYIDLLEEAVIRTIAIYGIKGERVEGATGVWIDKGLPTERKICAIGVKCSRYVSMHGLALNVNTDLTRFNAINPCGFVDKGVTSIAREVGREVDMKQLKLQFVEIFVDLLRQADCK